MVSEKAGSYIFSPKSIADARAQIRMSQSQLAQLIGVTVNTLSRWETGVNAPDANALASIYSVVMDEGLTPKFFIKPTSRKVQRMVRSRLVVMLDFQNLGVSARNVDAFDDWVMAQTDRIRPSADFELYKAFARPNQKEAIRALHKCEWRVQESPSDLDKAIIQQAKSNCGQDPDATTFVLVTKDGDFADLVKELRDWGTEVYVVGPQGTNQKLVKAAGNGRWIQMPTVGGRSL